MSKYQIKRSVWILLLMLFGCATPKSAQNVALKNSSLPIDWINGDFESLEAQAHAEFSKNPKDARAIRTLLFSAHVKGRYLRAAELYKYLAKEDRNPVVIRATVDSLIHTEQYSSAREVSKENEYKYYWYGPMLEARIKKPMRISIKKQIDLKFVSGSKSGLDSYMPGIEGKLVGIGSKTYSGTIRIDTGAEYLTLSHMRAKELGLEEVACQQGRQAENKTQVRWAQLPSLKLQKLDLINVPVTIVYSLPDGFEPILGTNILQKFKSELNYPENKLVLYSRQASFPSLAKMSCQEVPFFMWADHFMIAKGKVGSQKNLNYFIDSGLVAVAPGGRQAAIKIATEDLKSWGVEFKESEKIFETSVPIGLGPLEDKGHLIIHSPLNNLGFDFGGVRIHGLLGHAFYKKYVWRLDFDKMAYQLCER